MQSQLPCLNPALSALTSDHREGTLLFHPLGRQWLHFRLNPQSSPEHETDRTKTTQVAPHLGRRWLNLFTGPPKTDGALMEESKKRRQKVNQEKASGQSQSLMCDVLLDGATIVPRYFKETDSVL